MQKSNSNMKHPDFMICHLDPFAHVVGRNWWKRNRVFFIQHWQKCEPFGPNDYTLEGHLDSLHAVFRVVTTLREIHILRVKETPILIVTVSLYFSPSHRYTMSVFSFQLFSTLFSSLPSFLSNSRVK